MNNTKTLERPRCRYNHKTKKWDELVRISNSFIFINPNGKSIELPYLLHDTYKDIYK